MITIPDQGWRLLAACAGMLTLSCSSRASASGPCLDQITQAKAICARAAAVEDLGAPSEPPE